MMALPLVVGVDGSDGSLLAIDWAVDEAQRRGLPLRLVYASLWERYEGALPAMGRERPSEQVMAENIVGTAAERVRRYDPGLTVDTDTVPAEAVSALLAEGRHATAVVTGSRGRGELKGALLGSVSLAVASRADCPVVVVRGEKSALSGSHERVLLGAGDPDTSGAAVRFAFREADVRGCELDVVRAWRCPAYENTDEGAPSDDSEDQPERRASALIDTLVAEAAAEHPSVRLRKTTIEGPARKVLVHRTAAADLVVVGARHRSGHFGLQLGRVTHTLLQHAACPVAVVPQAT
ncbi:universal stress protein [Streptomyces violaceoruber]|uniref:Universal stress protein n=2 Tax=Streptomyces TaxID=1883 RepID=A0ACD4WZY2_STRVN|nr:MULTISPECIES: universal stress protein [Streptomyces]WOZ03002.1 universal stress protein [Streptomyces violaceoruber]MCW8121568.1 universal stress protein [Streptomyces anthocyanicus]MDX3344948.1 universal stress protein [Streptomyces sp. ME02-6979A]MDX3369743.1 universal stress protein [Streptomyces sp. ME02-6987-2C]MDX3425607.1 universal stress protein [Streptomyces sp. ME02-6985-2c]